MKTEKLRWGFVGCGHICHRFITGIFHSNNSEVSAVYGRRPERANAFADQYVALDDRAFIYDFCVFYQDVFVHVRMRKIVNYIGLVCRYRVRFTAVEKNTSFELALRSMWYCARSSSR